MEFEIPPDDLRRLGEEAAAKLREEAAAMLRKAPEPNPTLLVTRGGASTAEREAEPARQVLANQSDLLDGDNSTKEFTVQRDLPSPSTEELGLIEPQRGIVPPEFARMNISTTSSSVYSLGRSMLSSS